VSIALQVAKKISKLISNAREIEGCIADENDSDLRYSEVPLKGKIKTLVKILGGGGRDPCGVDAYGFTESRDGKKA